MDGASASVVEWDPADSQRLVIVTPLAARTKALFRAQPLRAVAVVVILASAVLKLTAGWIDLATALITLATVMLGFVVLLVCSSRFEIDEVRVSQSITIGTGKGLPLVRWKWSKIKEIIAPAHGIPGSIGIRVGMSSRPVLALGLPQTELDAVLATLQRLKAASA